jgi:vitamin B12 transporter
MRPLSLLVPSIFALVVASPLSAAEDATPPALPRETSSEPGIPAPAPASTPVIVVTADRLPTDPQRSTAVISVVDENTARERAHPVRPFQLLEGMPGVDLQYQNGGLENGTSIRIRGAHSYDTQLLVDGVPVNDPTNTQGAADFGVAVGGAGIDSIEVVRGTQSGLYGSRAIGGVIQVLTARPTADAEQRVRIGGGSFGTVNSEAVATGPIGRSNFGYALSAGGLRSDGISSLAEKGTDGDSGNAEKDGVERGNGRGRIEYRVAPETAFYASASGTAVNQDYDSFNAPNDALSKKQIRSWRAGAGGESRMERLYLGLDSAHSENKTKWLGSYVDRYRGRENFVGARASYEVLKPEAQAQRGATIDRAQFMLGSDAKRDNARIDSSNLDASSRQTGIYGQALIGNRYVEVSGTARGDQHDRVGTVGTWRAGLAIFPVDALKLHGSAATGFRAPSLYELYAPASFGSPIGNQNLEAERTRGYDAGYAIDLPEAFTLEGAWFRTDWKQGINYVFPGGYQNTGAYTLWGYEQGLSFRKNEPGLRLEGSWTWQQPDLSEADQIKSGLFRIPKNKGRGAWSWHDESGWFIGTDVQLVSRRLDRGGTKLHGYGLVGAQAGYTLAKGVELYARGENLGDRRYEVADGYSTPGASVFGGVNTSF